VEKKVVMAPDKGINKYLPHSLIDDRSWSDGNNVQFGVGYVQKSGGWQKFLNNPAEWQASTEYSEGDYILPTTPNDHVYKCTTAGTSGESEPTWTTTAGDTNSDGTAVWTEVGVNKLSGTLMAMDNYYQFDGDDYLIAITTTKCYTYDPENNTFLDITGGTLNGSTGYPVVTENAQNYFVFTNGIDPVKYWTGSGNIADLPGLDDCEGGVTSVRCKSLLYFQNFLVLGNTTEDGNPRPQRIRWSCIGDITSWKNVDGDASKQQAGYGDLTDDVSWVQAMRPLGNYVVVYKERAIQLINYVGGTTIWNKWPAFIGTGLLSTRALVDLGDEHIFVGNDNIYSFNGRDPAIAGDNIAKEFFRTLDPDKTELLNSFYIEEVPELWFSFVSIDSADGKPDKAICYNVDTKAWSFRDIPMMAYGYYNRKDEMTIDSMEFTIDSWNTEIDSSVNLANAPLNLAGDSSGYIYVLEGHSHDGAAIDSSLTTKLHDLDAPDRIKRLLRVQLMISREGPYNLPIYVGTADNVDEPVTWYGPYNMSLDRTYPPWIDVDISARYLALRMGTTGADEPFRLTGYILYYDLRGEI
jgi:hypothetical protein